MRSKVLLVLMIIVPVTAIFVFGTITGIYYIINRSTDKVPDSNAIYVYTVDEEFGELNQRYAKARGIEPLVETAIITYESVPEISQMDGVKRVYIFDDAAFSEFSERINSGETLKVAIPYDAYVFYGDTSGMKSVFGIDIPHEARLPNSKYVVLKCSKDNVVQVSEQPDYFLYYEYDLRTWKGFLEKLNRYIEENDAISDVSMLITTNNMADAANLQMKLMYEFPASNYDSAHYSEVWKESYNKEVGMKIALPSVCIAVFLICIEIVFARLRKPRKQET